MLCLLIFKNVGFRINLNKGRIRINADSGYNTHEIANVPVKDTTLAECFQRKAEDWLMNDIAIIDFLWIGGLDQEIVLRIRYDDDIRGPQDQRLSFKKHRDV